MADGESKVVTPFPANRVVNAGHTGHRKLVYVPPDTPSEAYEALVLSKSGVPGKVAALCPLPCVNLTVNQSGSGALIREMGIDLKKLAIYASDGTLAPLLGIELWDHDRELIKQAIARDPGVLSLAQSLPAICLIDLDFATAYVANKIFPMPEHAAKVAGTKAGFEGFCRTMGKGQFDIDEMLRSYEDVLDRKLEQVVPQAHKR